VTLKHEGTGAPHNLSVVGLPADFVPLVRAGQTSTASFTAPAPGTYRFVCTIHEAQGQTGSLVVLPN
jgi:plastocyanin